MKDDRGGNAEPGYGYGGDGPAASGAGDGSSGPSGPAPAEDAPETGGGAGHDMKSRATVLRSVLGALARLAGRVSRSSGPAGPRLRMAHACHVGGRDEQQDHVGVFSDRAGDNGLAVLADGMGGHHGGALASTVAVETAGALWNERQQRPADLPAFLEDLAQRAHRAVIEQGRQQGVDPRSTLVVLVVQDGHAYWMHLGDSRLYCFRKGELVRSTRDHSLVQAMVRAGEIEPDDAASHPDRNVVLRCIGGDDGESPKTTHDVMAVRGGDGFVLCSDGFWEVVSTAEMAKLLAAPDLQASLEDWVETAGERQGPGGDNVSAVAIRLERS